MHTYTECTLLGFFCPKMQLSFLEGKKALKNQSVHRSRYPVLCVKIWKITLSLPSFSSLMLPSSFSQNVAAAAEFCFFFDSSPSPLATNLHPALPALHNSTRVTSSSRKSLRPCWLKTMLKQRVLVHSSSLQNSFVFQQQNVRYSVCLLLPPFWRMWGNSKLRNNAAKLTSFLT